MTLRRRKKTYTNIPRPEHEVKDDEFHPNHTVAAGHSDRLALIASRDWHRAELARIEAKLAETEEA